MATTQSRGIGQSAFGGSDWGTGIASPAIAPAPSATTFARLLDPATGDYVLVSTGDAFETVSPVTQQVVIALTTVKGSIPQDPSFGLELPQKIGNNFAAEVDGAVRSAVSHIGRLELLSITTELDERMPHRFSVTVRFRDTLTGREDSVQVGAPS